MRWSTAAHYSHTITLAAARWPRMLMMLRWQVQLLRWQVHFLRWQVHFLRWQVHFYFISFVFLFHYLILNLLVAVVLESYDEVRAPSTVLAQHCPPARP